MRALARSEDPSGGGFGAAPKFPPSAVLEFLIRHAAAGFETEAPGIAALDSVAPGTATTGTAEMARGMAGRTLAAMSRSALFDQLGGGFARYSVTRDWSVPHFEKMLYDNAQLLRVYVHWVRLGGTAEYPAAEAAEVAGRTADWLLAALGLPQDGAASGAGTGALASSLDADTVVDGMASEGGTYLWTPEELAHLLGPADGAAVARLMNVQAAGTVSADGSPMHPGRALSDAEAAHWRRARPVLLQARSARPQPARDEKVVAGWNGLAVAGLAEAAAVLDRPDLLAAAERIAAYLERVHWHPGSGPEPGTLVRVSHAGAARGIGGLLEDYAFCAEGLLALYAVSGRTHWYLLAEAIVQAACGRFVADGVLRDTEGDSAQVFNAQGRRAALDPFDNAAPSGAAAFAGVLLAYSALSGSSEHRALAGNIFALLPPLAVRAPRVAGWLLATAQAALAGPVEAAVVGRGHAAAGCAAPGTAAFSEPRARDCGPGHGASGGAGPPMVPLLRGREAAPDGSALVYLCRGMVCDLPVGSAAKIRERLATMAE